MKKIAKTATRTAALAACLIALAAAFAGCGGSYDIDGLCDRLDELDCPGWQGATACVGDGKSLLARVNEAGGCDGAFDDYMACLTNADCAWASACSSQRAALVDCVGEFQTD